MSTQLNTAIENFGKATTELLRAVFGEGTTTAPSGGKKKAAPTTTAASAVAAAPTEDAPVEPTSLAAPEPKIEDVRAALMDLIQHCGNTKKAQEIVKKFGAATVSLLEATVYADVIREVREAKSASVAASTDPTA